VTDVRASAPDAVAAARRLRAALPTAPRACLVLGSGLAPLVERLAQPIAVSFDELDGLPASAVAGHAGRFVHGSLDGVPILVQDGRYHAYEGHALQVVVAPVRIVAELGVDTIIFTNAAGAIAHALEPGDLVLLDDHINFMFRSPLCGPVVGSEERFPDMSAPYDTELQAQALRIASRQGIGLTRGTYAAVLGPSYETAAEVRMLAELGADVVGMSTVPEAITARALGLRCLAVSMVTNKATGLGSGEISHEEVLAIGKVAGRRLGDVIEALVVEL
jgi:purine-nucleoside phosphorylase